MAQATPHTVKNILTFEGRPIVSVDGDTAAPIPGVTAQMLADVLAYQYREMERIRKQHLRDLEVVGLMRNPLLDDLPMMPAPPGPYRYEPTTKLP